MFLRIGKILISFVLMVGWIFSGWPQIFNNPTFPPEIEKVSAAIETRRPTTHTDNAGRTTNPANAYDTDGATFSSTDYGSNQSDSVNFNAWGTTSETYTNSYIKIRYHADAGSDDQYAIAYSTTGCSGSFTYLVNLTSSGASDTTVSSSDLGDISSGLNSVCVKIETSKSKGSDGSSVYLRDVWVEGTYTVADSVVSTTGTQTSSMITSSTNNYVGGAFVITENTGSRNVTAITIAEQGTVDALNDLDNIKLYYENDTSAPYDCASESYAGTESQFGSTDTNGFSAANGTSAFSGTSVGITTTSSMCVYVVLDVGSGASASETIEIQITDPSNDITVDGGGTVSPATAVAISGSTTLSAPGVTGSLDKTEDGWSGAIPVFMTLQGLSENTYQYARAKVDTPASATFYTDMTWDATNSRYEGVIYPGSNYCNGCVDPTTGTYTVTVQVDDNAGFPSVDYSDVISGGFSTYITRRKSSKGTAYDYTDTNAVWNTDHWDHTIKDFVIYSASTKSDVAVAIPFHPITANISNITVSFDGASVSAGAATSTANAWWWDSPTNTLYVQKASMGTTEVDVDITFDSPTDLWATRYDRVQTGDMGSREFYNGLFIGNQYLTASIYGGGHEGAGEQAETRAHTSTGDNLSTDCMERVAIHVDDTQNCDTSGYYTCNIKWDQQEWASYITAEDNNSITVVNNSDSNASTGWEPQKDYSISVERTQTYYAGERYIKNVYEITNGDSVSHTLPLVFEREQWLGSDRATGDEGRFYGDTVDVNLEQRNAMSGYSSPWMVAYDTGNFASMGFIFDVADPADYGIFAVEAFITNTTGAEWPVTITGSHSTQTADQTGFEKTFSSVPASGVRTFTFWQTHYIGTSWSDINSAMNSEYSDVNPTNSLPVASAVSIDSDATSVTLTENNTKNVVCSGTVTDNDGYAEITSVKADFYRTSVGTGGGEDDNNYYQLLGDSECIPSGGSGTAETYTCTFAVQYYADATDVGSPNAADTWTCLMTPSDSSGEGTADSDTIEIDSLAALNVTSSINYGTVNPNVDTGGVNQTVTVTNTGNRDMDPQLSGTNMTCDVNTIVVGSQKYSATSFTFSSGGTALTTTPTTLNITLPQRTSTEVTDIIYWGIGIPDGTPACTPYSGTNTFTAVVGI